MSSGMNRLAACPMVGLPEAGRSEEENPVGIRSWAAFRTGSEGKYGDQKSLPIAWSVVLLKKHRLSDSLLLNPGGRGIRRLADVLAGRSVER